MQRIQFLTGVASLARLAGYKPALACDDKMMYNLQHLKRLPRKRADLKGSMFALSLLPASQLELLP